MLLNAEDLVRGYAIDVWDSESGRWRSLCERVVVYTFLNAGTVLGGGGRGVGVSGADVGRRRFLARVPAVGVSVPLARLESGGTVAGEGDWTRRGSRSRRRMRRSREFQLETRAQANPWLSPVAAVRASLPVAGRGRWTWRATGGRWATRRSPGSCTRRRRSCTAASSRWRAQGSSCGRRGRRASRRSGWCCGATSTARRRRPASSGTWCRPKTAADMGEAHGLFDDPTTGSVAGEAYARFLTPPGGNEVRPWEGDSVEAQGTVDASDYGLPFVDADALRLPYLPDLFSRGARVARTARHIRRGGGGLRTHARLAGGAAVPPGGGRRQRGARLVARRAAGPPAQERDGAGPAEFADERRRRRPGGALPLACRTGAAYRCVAKRWSGGDALGC